jgi:release factor glutamine methyltransferase
MNIEQALRQAIAGGMERLDAQLLLLHTLERAPHDRTWLISHNTDVLDQQTQEQFRTLVHRRAKGEPLSYLTGHKEFFGLDLQVDTRVLDPRADTETLVQWALDVLQDVPGAAVLDLGTGSGAIALALKHMRPDLQVDALDASADALAVAQANAERLRLAVRFSQGSWLDKVSAHYHAIVSNPPYVQAHDPHLAALTHEPLQALVSGADGLDDMRQIIAKAPMHLQPGGWLLLEHGYDQAAAVRSLLADAGLEAVQSRRDLAGIERCSGGRRAHT